MPCLQSNWWVFTLNFGDPLVIPPLSDIFGRHADKVQYATWQHERVGRDHLQGVVQYKRKSTLRQAKVVFDEFSPHLEKMFGKPEQAIAYANKEESRIAGPWTYGEMLARGSNKRKIIEEYQADPEGMSFDNPSKARRIRAFIDAEKFSVPDIEFNRAWQIELQELINGPADDRTIIWCYGQQGGEGKSTFARSLITKGWFYSRGGKAENIKYAYLMDPARHVVFDYPRSQQDYVNYAVIEELKDRIIESTKYEPCQSLQVNSIHVIVMSNFLPEEGRFSSDRVKLVNCGPV